MASGRSSELERPSVIYYLGLCGNGRAGAQWAVGPRHDLAPVLAFISSIRHA